MYYFLREACEGQRASGELVQSTEATADPEARRRLMLGKYEPSAWI